MQMAEGVLSNKYDPYQLIVCKSKYDDLKLYSMYIPPQLIRAKSFALSSRLSVDLGESLVSLPQPFLRTDAPVNNKQRERAAILLQI